MPLSTAQLLSGASSSANAVDGCLEAMCQGLRFDFAEIWRQDSVSEEHSCVREYSPVPRPGTTPMMGASARAQAHKISPILCKRGQTEKMPLWFTSADPDTPLHDEVPINTAVVLPVFDFDTQQQFFVLLFAKENTPTSSSKLAYLRFIAKAVVVAISMAFATPAIRSDQPASATKLNNVMAVQARPELPSLYLQWSDLKNLEYLAEGGCSVVYTAEYNSKPVIAKILRNDATKKDIWTSEIRSEIELMQTLNHPNIIKFYGSGSEPRTFFVMEMLDGGTLNQRLGFAPKFSGANRHAFHFKDTKKPFAFQTLLYYAIQMADALRYLHDDALPGFSMLHRDLKPDNIGFKADGTLKLLDFGLAKALPKNKSERANYRMTGQTGSVRYMAPEVALNKQYDQKVDVYSWSFVVWEMATLTKPFDNYSREEFMRSVIVNGERPAINRKWPKGFSDLLQDCWKGDPNERPEMREVVERLRGLIHMQGEGKHESRKGLAKDRRSSWF